MTCKRGAYDTMSPIGQSESRGGIRYTAFGTSVFGIRTLAVLSCQANRKLLPSHPPHRWPANEVRIAGGIDESDIRESFGIQQSVFGTGSYEFEVGIQPPRRWPANELRQVESVKRKVEE